MGGMIAQIMALSQPSRVRSLNLIYTAPSVDSRYFVQHETQAAVVLGKRLEREEAIEEFVERERISASTAYPYDEEWVRELGSRAYERCYAPDGVLRQLCAISRRAQAPEALASLDMPSSYPREVRRSYQGRSGLGYRTSP